MVENLLNVATFGQPTMPLKKLQNIIKTKFQRLELTLLHLGCWVAIEALKLYIKPCYLNIYILGAKCMW
jgi:hypothetical protein